MVLFILTGCGKKEEKIKSTITLDINPSIEINLDKNDKVVNIKPLNDDAKDIISDDLEGKNLDDAIEVITNNVIDKGYVEDGNITILVYSKGTIDNNNIHDKINDSFNKREVHSEIIIVDKITDEDKELASKYNISPSKAAYINSIVKDKENIDVDNLVNKSVDDIEETKQTGFYCPEGYILDGSRCLKEVERINASKGDVCPRNYYEYKGKCYEEVPIEHTDKLTCNKEFKLVDNKCVRTITMNAIAAKTECKSGTEMTRYKAGLTSKNAGDANEKVCVDTSHATHPISPCETHDGTEYTVVGGKCYWHRAPVIASGCPGKIQVNGMCWDDASNILICEGNRDGKQYSSRSDYCEGSIKMVQPSVTEYKCEEGFTLKGTKCTKEEKEDAFNILECPNGYTQVNNDRCINTNNIKAKEDGYKCPDDRMRLKGTSCITYEEIEAIHY
jgi:hypothetical protein